MEATKMAELLMSRGLPVINIIGSRHGIDGAVEITDRVHIQVSDMTGEANVVVISADGEEFDFYQSHDENDIDALISDINKACSE